MSEHWKLESDKAVNPAANGSPVPDDIEDRLVLPLINGAMACLSEGIVADSDLLDARAIFGTGFVPHSGWSGV